MRLLLFFLMITSTTLVYSQNVGQKGDTIYNYTDINGLKQGYWKKYYDNKKIKYEGYFIDDKPSGIFKRYYEEGRVKALMDCNTNGYCKAILYYPSGKKAAEGFYNNQKRDSVWNFYTTDSILIAKYSYKNGKYNGPQYKYFTNGNLCEELWWKNGVKHGYWKFYYESGQVRMITEHKNGLRHGIYDYYFPDGKLDTKGQYVDDLKDGKWIFYNEDGSIKKIINYKAGVAENQAELDKEESDRLKELEKNKDKFVEPEQQFYGE